MAAYTQESDGIHSCCTVYSIAPWPAVNRAAFAAAGTAPGDKGGTGRAAAAALKEQLKKHITGALPAAVTPTSAAAAAAEAAGGWVVSVRHTGPGRMFLERGIGCAVKCHASQVRQCTALTDRLPHCITFFVGYQGHCITCILMPWSASSVMSLVNMLKICFSMLC